MSKDTITVSMNVHDIPIVVEALEKANKEIERLNKECDTYMKIATNKNKEIERLNNELEEFKEEHKIMKQILIENNLWETLLNDDRFLEHLRK